MFCRYIFVQINTMSGRFLSLYSSKDTIKILNALVFVLFSLQSSILP